MKMLKRILICLVVVVVLLAGIGFVLPRHAHVERAIEIKAPQAQIFDMVSSFKRFNEFSPWAELDPNMQLTYEGPESGVGAKMSWVSTNKNVGSGSNEIVEATAPSFVRTKLDFGDQGGGEAAFKLDPIEGGTRVTWTFDSDLGNNPIARYFGLMFDRFIGPDYEKGLAKLKDIMEMGNAG